MSTGATQRKVWHAGPCAAYQGAASQDGTANLGYFTSQHGRSRSCARRQIHTPKGGACFVMYFIIMQTAMKGMPQAAKLGTRLPVSNQLRRRPQAARTVSNTVQQAT